MVDEFYEYQRNVMSLYREQRYRDALNLALQKMNDFPDRRGRSALWIASLYGMLGEQEKSIQMLRESLAAGYWTSKQSLLRDPAFEPLRGREEFESILGKCESLRARAFAHARPSFNVFTPEAYSSGQQYPLVMALAFNSVDDSRFWKPALSANVIVAVLQSSQPYARDMYSWDDLDRSQKDVAHVFSELSSNFPIHRQKLILTGFSQGAALAIYLALSKSPSCLGFIGICPAPTITPSRAGEYASFLKANSARGLKGWILSGEKDSFLPTIKNYCDSLIQNGSDCKLIVEPNLGHEYPPNLSARLVEGVYHTLA